MPRATVGDRVLEQMVQVAIRLVDGSEVATRCKKMVAFSSLS